jgi:phosphatidate cytidylyltransferase
MLTQRLLAVIVLFPALTLLISLGGWAFTIVIAAALGAAAWEFWRMFHEGGFAPSQFLLVFGVAAIAVARYLFNMQGSDVIIAMAVLLAMAFHVVHYRKGADQAAVSFSATLAGLFYIGWLGAYLISVRSLPDGQWWLMIILPAIWFADSGAFSVGRRWGRHYMAPELSPKKSWEGYLAGIVVSCLLTPLLAVLWQYRAPAVTPEKALYLALAISIISPLGDFGESMLKRQFGLKDSGRLIPGHGGMLDRIDSMIWAAAIGYYMIVWFF